MLSLSIENDNMVLKDIDKSELSKIVKWFEDGDHNQHKLAMGIDKLITYEELYEKYLEVLINAHEFFLSINIDEKMVGFIKGRVDYKNEGEVWVMALLIDTFHQNMGVGKRALKLLAEEFMHKFGIHVFYACVVKDNVQGIAFWNRNGFIEYRLSKGYFTIENKSRDLVIMQKKY